MKALHKPCGAAGFSLLEVLIATAITGTLALVIATLMSNAFKSSQSVLRRDDLMAIRRTILNRISCDRTVMALGGVANCKGNLIDVYDRYKNLLISSGGTKFGDWTVRASCQPNGLVYVDIGRLKPGRPPTTTSDGDFFTDPANANFVQSWSAMRNAFFPVNVSPCEPYGAVSSVSARATGTQSVPYYTGGRTVVVFSNKGYDRLNEFDGTAFKPLENGFYSISFIVAYGNPPNDWGGGGCCAYLEVTPAGGSAYGWTVACSYPSWVPSRTSTNLCTASGSASVRLGSGDQVRIIASQTQGAAAGTQGAELVNPMSTFSAVKAQ